MKKRGQIFILAALILILVIFLLASQSNLVRKKLFSDKFEDVTKNYELEGNKLINSVLSTQGDPKTEFKMFSDSFVGYSTAQDPSIGTLYVLNYKTSTDVMVYNMNVEVKTIGSSGEQIKNCIAEYDASVSGEIGGSTFNIPGEACKLSYDNINKVIITTADGFIYTFNIELGKPQLKLVVKKDEKEETRVYYKNE